MTALDYHPVKHQPVRPRQEKGETQWKEEKQTNHKTWSNKTL